MWLVAQPWDRTRTLLLTDQFASPPNLLLLLVKHKLIIQLKPVVCVRQVRKWRIKKFAERCHEYHMLSIVGRAPSGHRLWVSLPKGVSP